ncbi:KRAB domain-containing protein [Capnocytophaga genosp. AHN8471]|nr:KRAB domain-containing protein [Capnocytophaga genosp. AHN8471]
MVNDEWLITTLWQRSLYKKVIKMTFARVFLK